MNTYGNKNFKEKHKNNAGKGAWVAAKNLRKGTKIFLLSTLLATVDSTYAQDTVCTVYNFEVANTHNYFVGKDGVLVHNTCDVKAIYAEIGITLEPAVEKEVNAFLTKRFFAEEITTANAANYKEYLTKLTTEAGRKEFSIASNNAKIGQLIKDVKAETGNKVLTDKGWGKIGSNSSNNQGKWIPNRAISEKEALEHGINNHLNIGLQGQQLDNFIHSAQTIPKGASQTIHGCEVTNSGVYTTITRGNERVRFLNGQNTKSGGKIQLNMEKIKTGKTWEDYNTAFNINKTNAAAEFDLLNLHIDIIR